MRTTMTTAAVVALLALPAVGANAQSALEAGNPIEGGIDFHVHSGPDTVARNLSDIAVAEQAKRRGMRGTCSRTT